MPTIGVSLAVPEPWGSRLQEFRVANGDAQGATIPTHITLVPPVEVERELLGEVEQHLAAVAAATRRTTCTCAAPARSARCRRWCS